MPTLESIFAEDNAESSAFDGAADSNGNGAYESEPPAYEEPVYGNRNDTYQNGGYGGYGSYAQNAYEQNPYGEYSDEYGSYGSYGSYRDEYQNNGYGGYGSFPTDEWGHHGGGGNR